MGDAAGTEVRVIVAAPLMNAAGLIKSPDRAREYMRLPVPAVLLGSFTVEARAGNPGDTFFSEPGRGTLNALGLPSPDLEEWSAWLPSLKEEATASGKELWVSVAGFTPDETLLLVRTCSDCGVDAIEVNLGCPNVFAEDEARERVPSYDIRALEDTLRVLDSGVPLDSHSTVGVKLSPILDHCLLHDVDEILNEARCVSFVTAINTVPNATAVGPGGKAMIASPDGLAGMGGRAVKWIALGQVRQHAAFLRPGIALNAVGGITTGLDIGDFLTIDRVSRCQVASALLDAGPQRLVEMLLEWDAVDLDQGSSPSA